jgi:hypothetical protein
VLEEGPCALKKWFQLLEQANIKGKSPQLLSTTLVLEIIFSNSIINLVATKEHCYFMEVIVLTQASLETRLTSPMV